MTGNAVHPHTIAVSAGRPAAVPDGPLNARRSCPRRRCMPVGRPATTVARTSRTPAKVLQERGFRAAWATAPKSANCMKIVGSVGHGRPLVSYWPGGGHAPAAARREPR
jgi:hypothetical protein